VQIVRGTLPGDFAASLQTGTNVQDGLKVGIVGINTTFLQLSEGNFEGRLALDGKQIHNACAEDLPSWTAKHDACILLRLAY
jgi:hypothetical protein